MDIRFATEQDCAALAALEALCLSSDPWSETALHAAVTDLYCPTLVAMDGDTVVGYVTGRGMPPEAELYRIATHPAYRGRGIGKALATAFRDALKALCCDSCFLEVRMSNTPARALYRTLGFAVCGTRRNYYRNPTEDAVLKVWNF